MERFVLAIVIPALNEGKTIKNVVLGVAKYGQPIVVNDASIDNTREEALSAGAVVVDHASQLGYDQAIETGFSKAKLLGCTHVLTFDGDGQHAGEVITNFIDKLNQGYAFVSGIRPRTARIAEKIFSIYTTSVYGWLDPLCGMKGYNITLYDDRGTFSSFKSVGTELGLYALKRKVKFAQIDIPIRDRTDRPRFRGIVLANVVILKSLWHELKLKLIGRYS